MENKTMNDFKDATGKIDWKAYDEYEMSIGEKCYECQGYIGIGRGERRKCYNCENINNHDEWDDDDRIRCPKCKSTQNISDGDDYELYSDGEHEVSCDECNYKFKIQTSVSYNFESPELLDEEEKN